MAKRNNKGRGRRLILYLLLFVIFFLAGDLAAYLIGGTNRLAWNRVIPKQEKKEKVILLLGIDARIKTEPSRSDTMMAVFTHPDEGRVDVVSIPRDSRVSIPGEPYKRKINYAHAKGGQRLLEKTLKKEFDIEPDGYIEVDFDAFEKVIDILGGVEINVEKRMYNQWENIDLQPGRQTLNGYDALAYVRYRGDGLGDIGRVQRQQKFLRALAKQAFSFQTILHSGSLIEEMRRNVKTDMSGDQMIEIARMFKSKPTVNSYMLPGEPQMINGASYWVIDRMEAEKLIEKVKNPSTPAAKAGENKDKK